MVADSVSYYHLLRYAMVKQLGRNQSQIDSIDIGFRKTDKLIPDQILHVVDMKYPHKLMSSYSGVCHEFVLTVMSAVVPFKQRRKS